MTAITNNLRYQLPRKSIKGDCPQCGPKHQRTLSRYVDTRNGELLPETFGRCDRESNCNYHLSPYHKSASGMSYADEVYQQWKADNPLTSRAAPRHHTYRKPDAENRIGARFLSANKQPDLLKRSSSASEPVYLIPDEVFRQTIGYYDRNQFARLLSSKFGQSAANELLQRFQIGTSAYWPGACVFWLIDEQHRARAGQVVLFAEDWHKARYTDQQGEMKVCISSVSHGLLRRYHKTQQPAPDWLTDYHENAPRWPILFGLHQLAAAPVDMPVAIVEAPKTAVICSHYFPDFVWLAVGALSYLNAERLAPLRGRSMILYPDASTNGKAFARWSKVAEDLNRNGYDISVSDLLEQRADDKQKQAGFDLADFLLYLPGSPANAVQDNTRN